MQVKQNIQIYCVLNYDNNKICKRATLGKSPGSDESCLVQIVNSTSIYTWLALTLIMWDYQLSSEVPSRPLSVAFYTLKMTNNINPQLFMFLTQS